MTEFSVLMDIALQRCFFYWLLFLNLLLPRVHVFFYLTMELYTLAFTLWTYSVLLSMYSQRKKKYTNLAGHVTEFIAQILLRMGRKWGLIGTLMTPRRWQNYC